MWKILQWFRRRQKTSKEEPVSNEGPILIATEEQQPKRSEILPGIVDRRYPNRKRAPIRCMHDWPIQSGRGGRKGVTCKNCGMPRQSPTFPRAPKGKNNQLNIKI